MSVPVRLVLFDVDATLITTSRSGIAAMGDAGREHFFPHFTTDRTAFSGRLDPLILADLLADNGLPVTPEHLALMRSGYRTHLVRRLAEPGVARTLPGVDALLSAVWGDRRIAAGLLTGNFEETGKIKLEAAGVAHERFDLAVWGTDSPHEPPSRDHLPPVALERFARRFGGVIDPRDVVIIGDTPHDIACARAHGCRCIGVATGHYGREHLSGADLVLSDLSATGAVLDFIAG